MATFKASEIFQFAVKIEENGEKFYRQTREKLDDPQLGDLFKYLADEEVKHKRIFSTMLESIEDYEPKESYPGEYFDYLKAYADNLIFSLEKLEEDIAGIEDRKAALEYGIEKELDTILYYQEMKRLVPESQRNKIDKILDEERKHVVRLSKLKRES